MRKKKNTITNYYDILTSIWIFACIEDNPLITYEEIKFRLNLAEEFDLKSVVLNRGELFRKQTQINQIDTWKEDMKKGTAQIPLFIRKIEDDSEIKKKIDSLTINDVFLSQFRTDLNSSRSELEIINWGLQHIDRLRKAELESNQEKTRIYSSFLLPILPTLVAIIALIFSYNTQIKSNENQIILKHYEVELKPKQEGYADFMKSVTLSFYSALQNNPNVMDQSLDKIESSYYIIEPFLSAYDRKRIWDQFQQFTSLCNRTLELKAQKHNPEKSIDSFYWFKTFFRTNLYEALFIIENEQKKIIAD